MPQGQHAPAAITIDSLAEQQPSHHSAQRHQMAFVAGVAVLTAENGQLTIEPGMGIHEGSICWKNPRLARLAGQPMT